MAQINNSQLFQLNILNDSKKKHTVSVFRFWWHFARPPLPLKYFCWFKTAFKLQYFSSFWGWRKAVQILHKPPSHNIYWLTLLSAWILYKTSQGAINAKLWVRLYFLNAMFFRFQTFFFNPNWIISITILLWCSMWKPQKSTKITPTSHSEYTKLPYRNSLFGTITYERSGWFMFTVK